MNASDWELLLDREPANWEARKMYAVWLQDEEDDLLRAGLQNWLANSQKCPHKMQIPSWDKSAPYYWTWWEDVYYQEGLGSIPKAAYLPGSVYGLVSLVTPRPVHQNIFGTDSIHTGHWRKFVTRKEAEESLIPPLVKLGSISSFSPYQIFPAGTKMLRTPSGYYRPAEKFEECDASFVLIEDAIPDSGHLKMIDLRLQPNISVPSFR